MCAAVHKRKALSKVSLARPYLRPYFCFRMKATVTSKGQVTIPQAIRRKLKLQAGTVLEFDERADHLKATKRVDIEKMRSVVGIAKAELSGKSSAEWMEFLRGPVELPRGK
jgi:AbrB family looped-hinge helix DNA binding protein